MFPLHYLPIVNAFNMDPTLTLEIPFVLLSLNDLKSSAYIPIIHQRVKPLDNIHATLLALCPDIPVHLIPSSAQTTPDIPWHLFPSPLDEHAILAVDERTKLSGSIWSCPAILQRTGIPIDTSESSWTLFAREASRIFVALAKLHAHEEQEIVHGETIHSRPWILITLSQAQLRISLVPAFPEILKRVLMLAAALERELTLLTTPSALLRYWSVSRFLEYRAVRQLGKEKAELRMKFAEKGGGRKADAYAREKKKCVARFDEEESASQQTKERRREWWDVVDSADIHALMSGIKAFKHTGRRLGVEPAFAAGDESEVTSLSFQQFPSTLHPIGIVAYTEIIVGVAHMACDFSHTQLSTRLVEYRQESPLPTNPRRGFGKILKALHVSGPSTSFFESYLDTLFDINASEPLDSSAPSPESPTSLFSPMTSHIATTLSSERAYIPTFIARYAAVEGFHPTPTVKCTHL